MVDSSNPDQGIKTKSPDDRIYSELAFVGFLMGGDLEGLGDGPPNLRWRTAHAFVPQYLENTLHRPRYTQLDPRAAELAAGRRPEKKCGLAHGKISASCQPGRKKCG